MPKNKFWRGRDSQLCIMSAILGCTNMGFKKPEVETVARLIKQRCTDIETATVAFTRQYMERDSDIQGFTDESKFIGKDLAKDGEKSRKYWKDAWELYENAAKLVEQPVETA